jgi:hypothetical protein
LTILAIEGRARSSIASLGPGSLGRSAKRHDARRIGRNRRSARAIAPSAPVSAKGPSRYSF